MKVLLAENRTRLIEPVFIFVLMLKRNIHILLGPIRSKIGTAQCPQIYDHLGNILSNPFFINYRNIGTIFAIIVDGKKNNETGDLIY